MSSSGEYFGGFLPQGHVGRAQKANWHLFSYQSTLSIWPVQGLKPETLQFSCPCGLNYCPP